MGDIQFAGQNLCANGVEHLLFAYETTGGNAHIADVTLTNNGPGTIYCVDTANPCVKVTAVDLIDLVGVNVATLGSHNIHFV